MSYRFIKGIKSMKRPFRDRRLLGPFVASSNSDNYLTIGDLRDMGKADHYDPIEWAGKVPNYLFHNTNVEGLEGIMKEGAFNTREEHLDEVFLGATVEENFGDFTFVFSGKDCIEQGFSPRTYLIDEEGVYKGSEGEGFDTFHHTNRGVIWEERLIGCYPEPIYSTFEYPNTGSRCNPDLNYDVYAAAISVFGLEPTGEIEVNENPDVNIAGAMQQTFVRDLKHGPIKLSDMGLSHIMYVDRKQEDYINHNRVMAEVAANELGVKAITNEEAVNMFPQLSAGKSVYDTEYITHTK